MEWIKKLRRGESWCPGLFSAMNILTWNYRGIGGPRTVQVLMDLIEVHKPNFFFLIETKCKGFDIKFLQDKLKIYGCLIVDSLDQSGGLALFWYISKELQ